MTQEEFEQVRPGKTLVKVKTEDGDKTMLVKFFVCNRENYDGYWMCCTEDLTNPHPTERTDDDWNVFTKQSEIIEL